MKQRTTVLVVDDVPLMRTILSKYIRSVGGKVVEEADPDATIDVLEARSGAEALGTLCKRSVDLVFLDLMMPEMDGLTFLSVKRDDPQLADVPVIVCSALGEKETLDRAQQLGARSYILKPFTVKSVESKLRDALLSLSD